MESPLVAVEAMRIRKEYASDSGNVEAIAEVSFSTPQGEFWAIVGPSGCGKTTLLKILGDLVLPTSGKVQVFGLPAKEARIRGHFSYVFQNPVLLPWRTVSQNVRLPLEILPRRGRDPEELLRMVGLRDVGKRYPRELSGGMQQRVALARALTYNPKVLYMDEPFGALDEPTRDLLNLELLRLWEELRVNMFLVTHSLAEAALLSDRIILLSPRPARVVESVVVPFLRPRTRQLRETTEFEDFVRCLRGKLA